MATPGYSFCPSSCVIYVLLPKVAHPPPSFEIVYEKLFKECLHRSSIFTRRLKGEGGCATFKNRRRNSSQKGVTVLIFGMVVAFMMLIKDVGTKKKRWPNCRYRRMFLLFLVELDIFESFESFETDLFLITLTFG